MYGRVTYRRTDTIKVRITIHNPNGTATVGQLRFENADYWEGILPIPLADHFESVTVPANGTKVVTVTLSGMPNYVSAGLLLADVSIDPTTGAALEDGLAEWIFLVDATPVGLQAIPWLELLEDSCNWASGLTGATPIATELTIKLFSSGTFAYNGGLAPSYFVLMGGNGIFPLRKFLQDQASSSLPLPGDCRDVSAVLNLVFATQGVSSDLKLVFADQGHGMITNLICPIGSDPSAPFQTYVSTDWNFHQIVVRSNSVFDACAAQAYTALGATYRLPPASWPIASYFQTENASWPTTSPKYYGLVDGYNDLSTDPFVSHPGSEVGMEVANIPFVEIL